MTTLEIGTCKSEPYVNHPRTTECVDFIPVPVRPLPDNLSHRVTPPAPAPAVKVVSDQGFWGKLGNAIGEALFGGGR